MHGSPALVGSLEAIKFVHRCPFIPFAPANTILEDTLQPSDALVLATLWTCMSVCVQLFFTPMKKLSSSLEPELELAQAWELELEQYQ